MDITNLWKYELTKGNSDHPAHGACLMDAAKWIVYGEIGDDPECACPIIRRYAIGLNDKMDDATRQQLKPFILRVVGNRDPDSEAARLHYIVLETARRVVPVALEAVGLAKEALALRSLPDDATFSVIKDAAYAAANAAYAYANAAYAAANAAYAYANAAYAAANAAYANANDAYAAANAAYANANDAYANANDADVWSIAIEILDGALRIGKQSPEFTETQVTTAIRAFERARESA